MLIFMRFQYMWHGRNRTIPRCFTSGKVCIIFMAADSIKLLTPSRWKRSGKLPLRLLGMTIVITNPPIVKL